MTQLNNSVLISETFLVNLMANFWWLTWCLVFTLVFHCCLCQVGPRLKKNHSAPAGFAVPNPAKPGPGRIWKNHIRCNPNWKLLNAMQFIQLFPWDDLRKILPGCRQVTNVLNGAETLPKISIGW